MGDGGAADTPVTDPTDRRSLGARVTVFGAVAVVAVAAVAVGLLAGGALSSTTTTTTTVPLGLVAACQADARTVGVAVAAMQTENPRQWEQNSSAEWMTRLLANSSATNVGGPFLQSWPSGNGAYYTISVAGASGNVPTSDTPPVTPQAGDVLVHATLNAGRVFDATFDPVGACGHLVAGT